MKPSDPTIVVTLGTGAGVGQYSICAFATCTAQELVSQHGEVYTGSHVFLWRLLAKKLV